MTKDAVSITGKAERKSRMGTEVVAEEEASVPDVSRETSALVSSVRFGVSLTRNIGNYESLRIEAGGDTQVEAGLESDALEHLAGHVLPFAEGILERFIPRERDKGKRFYIAPPPEPVAPPPELDDDLGDLLDGD